MKTILVPTDFSSPAQTAVRFAEKIAVRSKAQIRLLHVVEIIQGEYFDVQPGDEGALDWIERNQALKLVERSKRKLESVAGRLRGRGIKVTAMLKLGDAAHTLRTIVSHSRFDLIVMGTLGRTGIDAAVYGSNTIKVVRHSKSPLLIVHSKSKVGDFRNIVYPVVLRKAEERFGRTVKEMQRIFNARIHLVHINTPGYFNLDGATRRYMEAMSKRLGLGNCTINIFNDYSTEEGVFHFAETVKADLIAMATHGRGGLSQFLWGRSITESISRNSRLPVLTISVK